MRLPANTDNWTPRHADRAIAEAWRLFDRYDMKIDLSWPQERQDALYRPYQLAREVAVQVANITNWRRAEADRLP
jgi:hypothetical protein